MKANCILVRYGEIALKGSFTRRSFERTLVSNIKKSLDENEINYSISDMQGRIFINTIQIQKGLEVLKRIFGVTSCSPVIEMILDLENVSKRAFDIVDNSLHKGKSFALRVNRSGNHDFTSQDIAIKIGAYIQKNKDLQVDLTNPDFELFIEIRDNKTYLFNEKIRGPGGMPLGTQGKVVSIINSCNDILASWYLMKRGCKIIFLMNTSTILKTLELFLSQWHAESTIIIKKSYATDVQLNQIINRHKCKGICTGDVLYESPDETIKKIMELKQQFNIPVLNPLISFDKKKVNKEMIEKGMTE